MPTVSRGVFKWLFWRGASLENFADRLNHFWTFGLLLLLACIISWKHNFSKPISCWVPVHFTQAMQQYTEEICWYQRAVYLPQEEALPVDDPARLISRTKIMYQWLPIILCFQALLFKLPNLLMYILHGYSGVSFEKIASLTHGFENLNLQERDIIGRQTARYIYNWCKQFDCLPWRLLTVLWLVVKSLYCINILLQISLLNKFLIPRDATTNSSLSFDKIISGSLFSNDERLWTESPAFPRMIFCDFQITQLQSVQRWTVQCSVNANNFNEFVHMFIWVWFVFVASASCLSLFMWILTTVIPIFRQQYIKKLMALADDPSIAAVRPQDLDKFCNVVGEDGVMALKLISANSSELLVSNVVCNMWMLSTRGGNLQQAGQVLSLHEIHAQPSAPQASGTYSGTKVD